MTTLIDSSSPPVTLRQQTPSTRAPIHRLQFARFLLTVVLCGGLGWAWIGTACRADDTPEDLFLVDAQKYVITAGKDTSPLSLRETPVLAWTNPERNQERGKLYVWTRQGRPLVIGTMFAVGNQFAVHEFHSLADDRLTAHFGKTIAWTPRGPGIEWKKLSDSPVPADTAAGRNLQLRQVARQYSAVLHDPRGGRQELRLAPRPLFDYQAPDVGVIQGAIFTFVAATDPEILLLVEAITPEANNTATSAGAHFRVAFARFHYWKVVVTEGEKVVWERAEDQTVDKNVLGRMAVSEQEKSYLLYKVPDSAMLKPTKP